MHAWWTTGDASSYRPEEEAAPDIPAREFGTVAEDTSLDEALGKTDQVTNVVPRHGKDNHLRQFSAEDRSRLVAESREMANASCSPFVYWSLAAAGIDISAPIPETESMTSDGKALTRRKLLHNNTENDQPGETIGGFARTLMVKRQERFFPRSACRRARCRRGLFAERW